MKHKVAFAIESHTTFTHAEHATITLVGQLNLPASGSLIIHEVTIPLRISVLVQKEDFDKLNGTNLTVEVDL